MQRQVLLACDDSAYSQHMVDVAMQTVMKPYSDIVHVVTVLVPPNSASLVPPMMPMASAAVVVAIHKGYEEQRKAELNRCHAAVEATATLLSSKYQVPRDNIRTHVVMSEGGASGVSEALLHFAKNHHVGLIAVGNRGMGAVKRSLMSLVGLGSVSDALLRSAHCPVLLVRWNPQHPIATPTMIEGSRKVCMAYDGSTVAGSALKWCLDQVLLAGDHLYVVTVERMVSLPVFDDPGSMLSVFQEASAKDKVDQAVKDAQRAVDQGVRLAASRGVARDLITPVILTPGSGLNEIGGAIAQFAHDNQMQVVVIGCRGLGAMERGLMSFLGLGSVSEYLAHNLHCALAVVHEPEETAEAAAEHAHAD